MTSGRFNERKKNAIDHIAIAIPEGHVVGNWRTDIHEIVRNLPYISVRFGPDVMWDVYDRNLGGESGASGSMVNCHISIHVFHSNCNEDGEERGKYAQDVASRIIDYSVTNPELFGFDFCNISVRESEPSRGANRISRVIIEGTIQIKRYE